MRERWRYTTTFVLSAILLVAGVLALRAAAQAGASAQAAVPGPSASAVNLSKFPDVQGVRLTMPAQDAIANLAAPYPRKMDIRYSNFQGAPDQPWVSLVIGDGMQQGGCKTPCGDTMTVLVQHAPARPPCTRLADTRTLPPEWA